MEFGWRWNGGGKLLAVVNFILVQSREREQVWGLVNGACNQEGEDQDLLLFQNPVTASMCNSGFHVAVLSIKPSFSIIKDNKLHRLVKESIFTIPVPASYRVFVLCHWLAIVKTNGKCSRLDKLKVLLH